MTFKICSKCKVKKNVNKFGKLTASKDGYTYKCKECTRQYGADARKRLTPDDKKQIAIKQKQYRADHKEEIVIQKKQYYLKNREDQKQYYLRNKKNRKQYNLKNREEIAIYLKQYRSDNKEQIAIQRKQYNKLHPEIAHAHRCRRHGWGTPKPINEHFEGSHLHHLHIANDHQKCIYIPADLHRSISHAHNKSETMFEINTAIMVWYYTSENYLTVINHDI